MIVFNVLRNVFFPPSQTGEEAREVVETAFLHVKGIPDGMKKINREGSIFVLSSDLCPHFVIKIENPSISKFHFGEKTFEVEENSLQLRVPIANLWRKIIFENGLNLLYVPKKWAFSKGIIAEKLDLLRDTKKFFEEMTVAKRRLFIEQLWTFVCLTGFHDIRGNVALAKIDGVARLVIFDTEPPERISEADLLGNFCAQAPFPQDEKIDVIAKDRGRRDSNSQLPA